MKMMKLGIIVLTMFALTACTTQKPTVTELTKDQIQADVVSKLRDVYAGANIEDFAVASNTDRTTTKTVIGTMTVHTAVSSLKGEYKNTYEWVEQTWVLRSSIFTPKTYTWIDPSTYPDQARLEADLKNLDLTHPIDQIERFEYTTKIYLEASISFQITITYRSSIGTVTSQIDLGYVYLDQVWTNETGNVTSTSITDFTQRPDPQDMLTWSVIYFNQGDSFIQVNKEYSHVASSHFDAKNGILNEIYHIDQWVLDHLRYEADVQVYGQYNYDLETWEVSYLDNIVLKQTLDTNIKERFVWDSMNASESVFAKGETLDLELSGTMTITSPTETEWTLNVSGIAKINGVTHDLIIKQVGSSHAWDTKLELTYGPGPKDKFYLIYWWNDHYNDANWYLMSPDQSEAYLIP